MVFQHRSFRAPNTASVQKQEKLQNPLNTESLQKQEREFVVFPVSRHFPYSRDIDFFSVSVLSYIFHK